MPTRTYKITYMVIESPTEFTHSFVEDTMLDAINQLLKDLAHEGKRLGTILEVEICISRVDGDEVFSARYPTPVSTLDMPTRTVKAMMNRFRKNGYEVKGSFEDKQLTIKDGEEIIFRALLTNKKYWTVRLYNSDTVTYDVTVVPDPNDQKSG